MKFIFLGFLALYMSVATPAQEVHKKIAETERAFEHRVAEKGIRDGFIEFLAPVSTMFMPDLVNGREAWTARPDSPAALTWNPVWIDVSANAVMAYSIGNSEYRPKGKTDTQVFYGHYLSVWMKQPNGSYLAVLDTGINHERPAVQPRDWKSPAHGGKRGNPEDISAADSSVSFYQTVEEGGAEKAYKRFLATDAIILREGKLPAFDRKGALDMLDDGLKISFSKRKSFTEASDLAYVTGGYTITEEKLAEKERGNFVQVWKLRNKRWEIVADVLVPLPKS